jgi:hypothetical protein
LLGDCGGPATVWSLLCVGVSRAERRVGVWATSAGVVRSQEYERERERERERETERERERERERKVY